MKKNLFILLIVLFGACTTGNKPLSDADKDKIVGEAKVLVGSIIQACENPDAAKLNAMFVNSPDFVSLVGGVYAEYDQSVKNAEGYLNSVVSQKSTIRSEKYTVLDPTTVLYTANSKWEIKFKNDSTIVLDPLGMQFMLKKTDDQWKILSWTEEIK